MNALTRVRRDLRFRLADRYRALLGSRFVVLTAIAAAVLDRGTATVATVRRLRRGRPARPDTSNSVLRAAVTGGDELCLTLQDPPSGVEAVVLQRAGTTRTLPTILDHGTVLRSIATLPDDVCDDTDWTVAVLAGGAPHAVRVVDPAALATRPGRRPRRAARDAAPEPASENWPPRLHVDGTRLLLRARPPGTPGLVHTVEVGVRSAVVSWPTDDETAALLLVGADSEVVVAATLASGTARATVDLHRFDSTGTWTVFASTGGDRIPLQLPRGTFPPLDTTGRPHRVPLPAHGDTGRAVEVGYTADNQLVVRVGNFAPAAS